MSRVMLLVLFMMVFVVMTHYEWRQLLVSDMDVISSESEKQLGTPKREEVVKEKVILSQEKNIHRLNELVKTLKEQLQECQCYNRTVNTLSLVPGNAREVELEESPEPEPEPEE